ncbi:R3H domain-containing nucleic acid-binding protein [Granulicella sp. WH15]|uniref:R3H domain-containing nucleic acid-binding protein n=1 Tax=Granulicella sp. WH15 TaxID=2602070 RepID=UPI0013A5B946|nr:R3H domain-containing nucleic acid-binding protein [Granulicella sp. WH15]
MIRQSGLGLEFQVEIERRCDCGCGEDGLLVVFEGPDTDLLLANRSELLTALEHVTAAMLRLPASRRRVLSFDVGSLRAEREQRLYCEAAVAMNLVESTGRMYSFAPMVRRDRHILIHQLEDHGLHAESVGVGWHRHVVVYPSTGLAYGGVGSSPPAESSSGLSSGTSPSLGLT